MSSQENDFSSQKNEEYGQNWENGDREDSLEKEDGYEENYEPK